MNLTGRVALVTGGASGIGAATVRALAAAGAEVVLHFQHSEAAAQAVRTACPEPRRIELAQADLAQAGAPVALLEQVRQHHGRLDYLVNNAALTPAPAQNAAASRFDAGLWEATLAVNLRAPAELSLRAAELMESSAPGEAAIVNVGSATSLRGEGSSSGMVVGKAAIPGLTCHLARQLAPAIRVNAVLPGLIATEEIAARGASFETRRASLLARTPMGRLGTPEEVAELILFLLAGNTFITGQSIAADGGLTL